MAITPRPAGPGPAARRARQQHRATGPLVAALAVLLCGCAGAEQVAPPPRPVYQLPPRTVRPGESAPAVVAATDGDTAFELIGLTTGLPTVLGSHAEWPAKGQFVRIRLVAENRGRGGVTLSTGRQLLRTADGTEHSPDSQAMLIKRQPALIEVGAGNRTEFDLYYDVPPGAAPAALYAFGGPSLADFADATGVEIRLG